MADEEHEMKPNPAWKIALVAVPVFVALSSAVSMWAWTRRQGESPPDPRLALAAEDVSAAELRDHTRKLTELVGRRDWQTGAGRRNVRRVIAFIDGTLGPRNYGFQVRRDSGPTYEGEQWPILKAELTGSGAPEEVVLVLVPYDREAAPVVRALAAANDLRDEDLGRTVRFVFHPSELTRERGSAGRSPAAGESLRETVDLGKDGEFDLPGALMDGPALMRSTLELVDELRRLTRLK